jgi:hypothetical protein
MRRPGLSVVVVALGLGLALAACSGSGSGDDAGDRGDGAGGSTTTGAAPATTTTLPAVTAARLCADTELGAAPATVAEPDLTEISGVVASRQSPGVLWMHNDSGGDPEVFAVGTDGAPRGRYALAGAEARDWEDIALGPGPDEGVDDLYLGDIGDNTSQRSDVTVYRVAEPAVAEGDAGGQSLDGVAALTLTYADGARDAETLLSDPVTSDLFVVSKQWDGAPAGVYRIPADVAGTAGGASATMERVADAGVPSGELATGGDISADGSLIAIRTYQGVLLWDRAPDQTVGEALAGEPCEAAATSELQGEAVAFLADGPDGPAYVTVSEGQNPPINRFALP